MENNQRILTSPNKEKNSKISILSLTPKLSKKNDILLSVKQNSSTYIKPYYYTSNKKLTSNINNINSHQNKNNSKNDFLIPYPIRSKSNTILNSTFSFVSKTDKKPLFSNNSNLLTDSKMLFQRYSSKFNFSQSKQNSSEISPKTFLNKKRKYMTSEEIELEQIEKEKTASKKLREKNRNLYIKSLKYTPIKIIPTPLTTFKPFNLSSNKNTKYLKEGKSNTLYEINKLNQKIRQKMQQKIEALTDVKTKNQILLNNTDYLKKQNMLYNDLFNEIKNDNDNDYLNHEKIKNNINENKDINNCKNFMTPHKNYLSGFGSQNKLNIFNSLNKGNNNHSFSTQIKKYADYKGFCCSKIMNYYLTSYKK
jgi:hypothetical protein